MQIFLVAPSCVHSQSITLKFQLHLLSISSCSRPPIMGLIINDISGQSKLTSASIMASSKLGPFSFLDLPPELRLKIYREIFAGSVIRLTLTQKYSRTAIRDWTPPKHISFLRSSSQIYEESLPILARSSRLELLLMEDPDDREISTSLQINLEHLLTSPATSLFLRSTLPLIRAMDLDISVPICLGRLEGLETLTSLRKVCSAQSFIYDDCHISEIVGDQLDKIDGQFFQDFAWESKILTAFKTCLDIYLSMLKDIITEKAGTLRLSQCLWFVVDEPGSEADLVSISTMRKLLIVLE
jgi:hypothetical protein